MATAPVKVTTNIRQLNRNLSRAGISLQEVVAESVNFGVEDIERKYKHNLKREYNLKNNFSLGSTRALKSRPFRSSGQLRPLSGINAIVGVRKMKGGKEHYLAKAEEGGTQRGNAKTKNRVPVPLVQSRTGKSEQKPIAGINRLIAKQPQTLRAGGRNFGLKGDGFGEKQRFAILHKYRRGAGGLTGDLSKPFFFVSQKGTEGIFRKIGQKFRMMRSLTENRIRVKRNPQFEKSVDGLTPARMDAFYRGVGKRKLMAVERAGRRGR